MRDFFMDEELLGQVDAWLASLRAQGLSDRPIRQLAGLLGTVMGTSGPRNVVEERVLRRLETW